MYHAISLLLGLESYLLRLEMVDHSFIRKLCKLECFQLFYKYGENEIINDW